MYDALAGYGAPGDIDGPPDYQRHNAGITAKFHVMREPLLDVEGNPILDAAGKPSEHETEVCTMVVAGDGYTEICRPAVDSSPMSPHIRFKAAYDAWKAGAETSSGTSLADCGLPEMTPRSVRDLGFLNIETVARLGFRQSCDKNH